MEAAPEKPSLGYDPMALYYNDVFHVELPEGHRFPMEKYFMVRRRLQNILGPGRLATFSESPLASQEDLQTAHCPEYVRRYLEGEFTAMENRVVGFPWSEASVNRALSSVGGTVAATHAVCGKREDGGLGDRVSGHIAGGTHHAFHDRGEGFCVFSDIAVAARVALRDYDHVRRVLIVDLDVHQGNGNAAIFQEDARITTFSVHCKQNLFSRPLVSSDVDIEVEAGMGDEEYLELLASHLPRVLESSAPDLVFYQAGVDPGNFDRLGKLNLTPEGLKRRDAMVFQAVVGGAANTTELGAVGTAEVVRAGIPLVVTMGGGYPRDLDTASASFGAVVSAHAAVYVEAARANAMAVPYAGVPEK
eukprot:CAMPEP_0171750898 /NCGR_PEP_ID=MMETSP0991-20121206/41684_1 /TAXON_ID=483369 /ORGANISM="non described non described, Strain CCMP2098" /LENGTH=360 /DNA_ID=CAMNT_0012351957 /DNA_START=125 /DNA_END=1207 /DNA_ORIENTATION=+